MEFFDINCWAGSEILEESSAENKSGDLFSLFSKNKIKKAVLTNRLSYSYDWNYGNENLLGFDYLNQNENIFFSFILCPDVYHQFTFSDYMRNAYKSKVRMFRIFPKSHLFYINDYYMKKIYNHMGEAGFPLMLDLKELDITGNKYFAIDDLRKLLKQNKEMPVILETSLKQCMFNRFYFPLLEEFENLYIEISGMLLIDQIEHYVGKFGSNRLVFGSNFPGSDFAVNTGRMESSEISMEDKENICFRNVFNLFNNIKIQGND